jgi:hypothetical protein
MYARRGATEILIQGYGSCVVSHGAPLRQNSFGRPEPGTHVSRPPQGATGRRAMVACGHGIGFAAVSLWLERCDLTTQKKPLLNLGNPFENLRLRRTEESRSGRC